MNTNMRVVVYPTGNADARVAVALAAAEALVRSYEDRFSRFLPGSELSLLNTSAGRWSTISSDMSEVLALALEMASETGGLFDPGVLPQLEWAGYDRSFEAVLADRPAPAAALLVGPGIGAVELDGPSRVRLPAGCRLDFGGIVKGWAADRVADLLADLGATLVDLGGDIAVRGSLPEGSPWRIGVEPPDAPGEFMAILEVAHGGVATSGTNRRRWHRGGAPMHHIIDPRTGQSACSDLSQAVALAPNAARADIWAKTAVILGQEACEALVAARTDVELLLVAANGTASMSPGVRLCGVGLRTAA
ncbi:MAG TPA: FAD:protein FMN transferase [Chloroflexota bacterium]|nr:FAD:protein FMN transferase [Chloroflexota bacterium]